MRTVTSMRGRPSSASGITSTPTSAAILVLPDGPHAEQGEDLGHVVAVGAHGAGAPDADADRLGIAAGLVAMTLEHFAGQLLADLPGGRATAAPADRRRRSCGPSAGRGPCRASAHRSGRPGRNGRPGRAAGCRSRRSFAAASAPGDRRRKSKHCVQAVPTRRMRHGADSSEAFRAMIVADRLRAVEIVAAASSASKCWPSSSIVSSASACVTSGRPASLRQACWHGGQAAARARRASASKIEAEALRPPPRAGWARPGSAPASAPASSPTSCSPCGHLAEDVQAVADLGPGQLAQVAVEILDQMGKPRGRASGPA